MDDLRQFFKDAVTDQLSQIERLSEFIGTDRHDQVETLRRLAHSLKGSGATYGFPAVSDAAAVVVVASDEDLDTATHDLIETLREVAADSAQHRVLVVDDDPLIARILESHIGSADRRVVTAGSLAEARTEVSHSVPSLIVLDLFLPDGDGRTLLSEIRQHEMTAAVPIMVISASPEADTHDLKALGADAVIHKPFDPIQATQHAISLLRDMSSGEERTGRSPLSSTYRSLLARGADITVAVVIPETHGPGGRRAEGGDTSILLNIQEAIIEVVGTRATIGSWNDADITMVTAMPPDELHQLLDRSRLRLRSAPHPSVDGALASFSAAVISDDGGRGLHDAHARAHRFALDFNREGGDRVRVHGGSEPNRRVLLAEDDTLTAALIIHRLEREGFEVIHHADGTSAAESLEQDSFGLVVLDVQMPGLDGFQVLQRVRSIDSLSEVPVVMLTAVGSERDVVRGFELGADDYILKPFSPAELTARLKRFTRH